MYHPRTVELVGSIPGDLTGSDETAGAVPFRIEGKMRRIKTILGPRRRSAEVEPSRVLSTAENQPVSLPDMLRLQHECRLCGYAGQVLQIGPPRSLRTGSLFIDGAADGSSK